MKAVKTHLITLAAAVMVAAGISGCISSSARRPDPRADTLFDEASQAYMKGDYPSAVRMFADYRLRYPRSLRSAEASYWEGLSLLEAGHAVRAERRLSLCYSSTRDKALKALALKGSARAKFVAGEYDEAEKLYYELLSRYRGNIDPAEIYAAIYECNKSAGHGEKALRIATRLRDEYPASPYSRNLRLTGANSGKAGFIVQAGVFSKKSGAEKQMSRLKRAGFDCFVSKRNIRGSQLYFVQAGAFSSKASAQKRVAELKRKGFDAGIR